MYMVYICIFLKSLFATRINTVPFNESIILLKKKKDEDFIKIRLLNQ